MNYDITLGRSAIYDEIRDQLREITANIRNPQQKRCIFIHGDRGIGKTTFVRRLLASESYDVITLGDGVGEASVSKIPSLTSKHVGTSNIFSLLTRKKRQMVVVVDGIGVVTNAMSSDNTKISSLLKMVRPKRTARQLSDDDTVNIPVICISGNRHNKRVTELIKVSYRYQLAPPTPGQYTELFTATTGHAPRTRIPDLHHLHRMVTNISEYTESPNEVAGSDCPDEVVSELIRRPISSAWYSAIAGELDKTVIGMNLHENIIDYIPYSENSVASYKSMLDMIVSADHIDRNIFQSQLWQLSALSSSVKIAGPSAVFHAEIAADRTIKPKKIRFTKILTKYSSEYSNQQFIQKLCNELHLDAENTFQYFHNAFGKYTIPEVVELVSGTAIGRLDVARMARYLNGCLVPDPPITETTPDVVTAMTTNPI
jgi:hypothetical protein